MGKKDDIGLKRIRSAALSAAHSAVYGKNQKSLGERAGIKDTMMSAFLSGRSGLGAQKRLALCEVLGLDPHSGECLEMGVRETAGPEYKKRPALIIPLLGAVAAGPPSDPGESVSVGDEDLGRMIFPEGLWKALFPGVRAQGLSALRVSGSSMAPRHNDGDLVFVRRTEDRGAVRDGQEVVLYLPGEGYTFKVWRDGGILESVNRAFAPRVCPKGAKLWGVYVCGTRMG